MLKWTDEFEGPAHDEARWHHRLGESEFSVQKPESVSVSEGFMRIAQERNQGPGKPLVGGGLITREPQGFGYYETRVRMGGPGWHEAFWTTWLSNFGIPPASNPDRLKGLIEIDGFEHYGSHSPMEWTHGVIQWAPVQGNLGRAFPEVTTSLDQEFHTFGFEVQPGFLRIFFEGQAVGLYDLRNRPEHPFHLWLTCIGTDLKAQPGGEALFDYCRAYQLPDSLLEARRIEAFGQLEKMGQGRGKIRSEGTDLWIDVEDFPRLGGWTKVVDGNAMGLMAHSGPNTVESPEDRQAATSLMVPQDGAWTLWARSRDYSNEPGTRTFRISVDGKLADKELGRHGTDGWAWEKVGTWNLKRGIIPLALVDLKAWYARVDRLLLTTDADFKPDGSGGDNNVEHDPVQ